MPLSLRRVPQELTPTYNQVVIVATSSQQSQLNYQLVSEIFCRGAKVTTMKTPVNPEGYIITDIHKHLENRISYDFNPGATGFSIATQSFATYSVNFFDEFRHIWDFTDNFFSSIGGTAYAGFVSQQTPYFSIGDYIYISQDAGYVNASYNGVHQIIQITQSGLTWSITTNTPFGSSSPANPGEMTYADFSLTQLPVGTLTIFSTPTQSTTASFYPEQYAFNGVLSYLDFINWNFNEWAANTGTTGKFFTNAPNRYPLDIESLLYLDVYQNAANEIASLRVKTNVGTFSIANPFTTITADQRRFLQINCSPDYFASLGWINSQTTTMELWCENNVGAKTISSLTFSITDNCSRYDKQQVLFMDKMGSFVPYTFDLVSRENKNISRTDYQQHYGSYAPATQQWRYNTWDRGRKSLDIVVVDAYTLNSNWVNQDTSDYLMELFESPEVYLVKPDGTIVAININVASVERKQVINDQLINYVLTFELSNKNMTQRG
jgi:hypothetical protein